MVGLVYGLMNFRRVLFFGLVQIYLAIFLKTLFSKEVIDIRKKGLNKKFDICSGCSIGTADYMGYNYSFEKNEKSKGVLHS